MDCKHRGRDRCAPRPLLFAADSAVYVFRSRPVAPAYRGVGALLSMIIFILRGIGYGPRTTHMRPFFCLVESHGQRAHLICRCTLSQIAQAVLGPYFYSLSRTHSLSLLVLFALYADRAGAVASAAHGRPVANHHFDGQPSSLALLLAATPAQQ